MAALRIWLHFLLAGTPATVAARQRLVYCLSLFSSLFFASSTAGAAANWTKLTNDAPSSISLMVQLTDGTILAQSFDGKTWMKLTPDAKGSYIDGTWALLAPAPIPRLYFASQVLPNGKFWLVGGEYSGPGLLANWSNTGEVYDPIANTWSSITPYPSQPGCPQIDYVSGNLTNGSAQITGIYPYTTRLAVGWGVSGIGIPAGATILSIDSATQITISANATVTRVAGTINFNHSYTLTACLGDHPSMILPGGMILNGDLVSGKTYLYNTGTDSWAQAGTKVYPDSSDEEGWVKLANGTVLTYDLFRSVATVGSYAETYDPTTGNWSSVSPSDGSAAGVIPQLSSQALGSELGPLIRLQDGRILAIGATQHTALYNPSTTPLPTWEAGPDIVGTLNGFLSPFGADDAPAAILPNGHVIFAADAGPSAFTSSGNVTSGSNIIANIPSTAILQVGWGVAGTGIPVGSRITSVDSPSQIHINHSPTSSATGVAITFGGTFSSPTQLFDFNPGNGLIGPVSPAIPDANLTSSSAFPTRMLILPTGQLLFSDSSAQLWAYTPDGAPNPALRPVINGVSYNGGGNFTLTGKQLNGRSAGAAYGDDDEMDENYPIIRMTNSAGNVFYARSTNWSLVGVEGGPAPETVNFTLHPSVTPGNYTVIVSGAGISSFPLFINITAAEVNKQ
jgi:hypothetical protein